MERARILLVVGTRPEAIKMAPVYMALSARAEFEVHLLATAQHREMLDQTLASFRIQPDFDLDVMRSNQDLYDVTSRALTGMRDVMRGWRPDCVLVQGDTTSAFVGGLAAFYEQIPVGHVEAGLRTGDRYSPFPEEINRRMIGTIATFHFAPTSLASHNLLAENVPSDYVFITGNTAIDALLWTIKNLQPNLSSVLPQVAKEVLAEKFVLLTMHRRESFGAPMERAMSAIGEVARRYPAMPIIFPVHFNPNVRQTVSQMLGGTKNVIFTDPLDYTNFAHLMNRAYFVLTDSGGIQEEAPSLGKPVLVLRDNTERPEGVDAGVSKLVGTNPDLIVGEYSKLIEDQEYYQSMSEKQNPYGDGNAGERIAGILLRRMFGGRGGEG